MTDSAKDFITWAEMDRNRSPNTLVRYRIVLDLVFPEYGDPSTITRERIEEWWATRYHLSAATRANELACLRAFCDWMVKFDHRLDDPTRRLAYPPVPNRLPRMIGRSDLGLVLGELTDGREDLRRAVALGVYGGLRVAEAASLDWADVDLDQRRIYVRGKGQKERAVGASAVLLDYILPERRGRVVSGPGRAYTSAVLQRKINRLMDRNGINHTFHDFRKRGASLALSRGMNPVAVKQMFGWSSMETVSSYAVVGSAELDLVAEAMV